MAASIDTMDFVRGSGGKLPGWGDEHTEAVADTPDEALKYAKLTTVTDLGLLEGRITIQGAFGLAALGGFLAANKYFG